MFGYTSEKEPKHYTGSKTNELWRCFPFRHHFGPEISVGNVHSGLICVDRYSWMTYIYPLKKLTTDIQKQLELFFCHLGLLPHQIITDFDLKLIGGKAREYLNRNSC
jgi:hypothetical protein